MLQGSRPALGCALGHHCCPVAAYGWYRAAVATLRFARDPAPWRFPKPYSPPQPFALLSPLAQDAIKAYVASSGLTAGDLASSAGKAAVTAHVIPNKTLKSADFPQGSSSYETVAGSPLMVNNT